MSCLCGDPDCERMNEGYQLKCAECGGEHVKTRCKGACRRTMCINNPHARFYCPLCHEVHCGMKRQGEWIVQPHYRVDVTQIVTQSKILKDASRPCRGGPVDYEKDKAP